MINQETEPRQSLTKVQKYWADYLQPWANPYRTQVGRDWHTYMNGLVKEYGTIPQAKFERSPYFVYDLYPKGEDNQPLNYVDLTTDQAVKYINDYVNYKGTQKYGKLPYNWNYLDLGYQDNSTLAGAAQEKESGAEQPTNLRRVERQQARQANREQRQANRQARRNERIANRQATIDQRTANRASMQENQANREAARQARIDTRAEARQNRIDARAARRNETDTVKTAWQMAYEIGFNRAQFSRAKTNWYNAMTNPEIVGTVPKNKEIKQGFYNAFSDMWDRYNSEGRLKYGK